MSGDVILRIDALTKDYPGVRALDAVSFECRPGEVHAIIGENGAGKSTLIKCLAGAIAPDGGSISVGGHTYNALNPSLAKQHGISVIYQEFNNVPPLSVAENVFLCEKTDDSPWVNTNKREKMAAEIFERLGVRLNPAQPVRTLSPAGQQLVEIAKAVSKDVKILIMDEPTAPLTVSEVETLFKIVRDLKAQGVTIIYISHRLEELFEIADRVTVLRDGKYIATKDIADTSRRELISLMAGRELAETYPSRNVTIGEEVLRTDDISGNGVEHISFALRKGEILGFAGLVGAGRTELMQVLYGVVPRSGGDIYVNGEKVNKWEPLKAISRGLGMIPEDRKGQGLFLSYTLKWNIVINAIRNISKYGVVNKKLETSTAKTYLDRLRIKAPSDSVTISVLSGGNQQKVVLAKTMAANADIVIFDEPTRGIDVGAKQEIYKLMNELAEAGHSIIMVSSEMPELLGMSDRIIVIAEGRQVGELPREQFDQTTILEMASIGGAL